MRTHPTSTDIEPSGAVGADDELGRAAADVDDEVRRVAGTVELGGRAEERERGLLVTGEQLELGAEDLRRRPEEVVAVGRVARRARRGRADASTPPSSSMTRPVLAQRRQRALDRVGREPAGGVDALAEPGDRHPPVERDQRPVAVG